MNEETIIRTAVVTGGSRGIGRAVCVQLARQGCHVVVNYCHGEAAAAETVSLCRAEGAQAVAVQADVSTAEGCKKLFEEAVNAFGRVDILVNNAGITRDNLILRMSEADFDAVLDANLKAMEGLPGSSRAVPQSVGLKGEALHVVRGALPLARLQAEFA